MTLSLPAGHKVLGSETVQITDVINALASAWTSYTPTWTAATTNPAIGNGQIRGRYLQAGKLIVYTWNILMGSTTTFGTGAWRLSVPVSVDNGNFHLASVMCRDASVSGGYSLVGFFNGSVLQFSVAGTDVGSTTPITWTTSDIFSGTLVYGSL